MVLIRLARCVSSFISFQFALVFSRDVCTPEEHIRFREICSTIDIMTNSAQDYKNYCVGNNGSD